jgi:hypothetical protein
VSGPDAEEKPALSPSLREIGRKAADRAQREALLATLDDCRWNLMLASTRLRMGGRGGSMMVTLRRLGLMDAYDQAKAAGLIRRGRRARVHAPAENDPNAPALPPGPAEETER